MLFRSSASSSGCPIHFVGDPHARVVYVTEGALKADIAHALTGRTFAATVGAGNTNGLDELFAFLYRNGTEEIIEAAPAQRKKKGFEYNDSSYFSAQYVSGKLPLVH